MKSNEIQKALKAFTKAKKILPNIPGTDLMLAAAYHRSGDYENAEKHIHQFLNIKKRHKQGLLLASDIAKKMGKEDKIKEFAYKLKAIA